MPLVDTLKRAYWIATADEGQANPDEHEIPDVSEIEWQERSVVHAPLASNDIEQLDEMWIPWKYWGGVRGVVYTFDPTVAGGRRVPGQGEPETTGLGDLVWGARGANVDPTNNWIPSNLIFEWWNWKNQLVKTTIRRVAWCVKQWSGAEMTTVGAHSLRSHRHPPLQQVPFMVLHAESTFELPIEEYVLHEYA